MDGVPGYDFFIAYAKLDLHRAEELFALLGPHHHVFLDEVSIPKGQDWDVSIITALQTSRIIVVLVTKDTDAAYFQRNEVQLGLRLSREKPTEHTIIPIFYDAPSSDGAWSAYGLGLKQGFTIDDTHSVQWVAGQLGQMKKGASPSQVIIQNLVSSPPPPVATPRFRPVSSVDVILLYSVLLALLIFISFQLSNISRQRKRDVAMAIGAAFDTTLTPEIRAVFKAYEKWREGGDSPKQKEDWTRFFCQGKYINLKNLPAPADTPAGVREFFDEIGKKLGDNAQPKSDDLEYVRYSLVVVLNCLEQVAVAHERNAADREILSDFFSNSLPLLTNTMDDFIKWYRRDRDPGAWLPLTDFRDSGTWKAAK